MGKYHYSKKYLKGLGVGAFLGQVKLRNKHIEEASDELKQIKSSPRSSRVTDVAKELKIAKEFIIIPLIFWFSRKFKNSLT